MAEPTYQTQTYTPPDYSSVYSNEQYTTGENLINQSQQQEQSNLENQLSGLGATYDTRRSDLMRSYQDALDQINTSLRQAGIGVRQNYASRNLYDASGDVSGIGQGYAGGVLNPIYQTLNRTSANQAQDLRNLGTERAQAESALRNQIAGLGTKYDTERFNLAQQIYGSIRDAARQQYEDRLRADETQYSRSQDALNDPTSRVANEAAGRQYIGTIPELERLSQQYGRDALVLVGGNWYLKSPEERLSLQQTQAQIAATNRSNRSSGGGGSSTPEQSTYTSTSSARDSSGGYAFTGKERGTGNVIPITPYEYAQSKGLKVWDVLVGSTNPGDEEILAKVRTAQSLGLSPDQIEQAMRQDYPWLFEKQ